MYTNLSSVTLYKLPIPLTRMDNINWSIVNKDQFFNSIPKLEIDDWTDLYASRDILLPLNAEIARDNWNYMKMHYENEVGVNQDYYYFIENYMYISQEVCAPIQIMDTWTTYSKLLDNDLKYYVNRLTCKAERFHQVDGQSAPKYKYQQIGYDDSVYYAVLLNKSRRVGNPTGKFNLMFNGNKIDEIPFEGIYVFCNSTGLQSIKDYEYAEYIENIYSIVGEQISFCKSQVDSNSYVYYYNQTVNIGKTVSVSLPTGYTDIMLRFPYFYVDILGTIYDPIDFNNQSDIKFLQLAVPISQGGISYIPINYRGSSINKYYTTTIKLSSPIGGILNYNNSIAYKQATESNSNTIGAANRSYNTTIKSIADNTSYQQKQSNIDYNNTLFENKVADLEMVYNIPLGFASTGALVAGASFLGDIPLLGGAFKAVSGTISSVATQIADELQTIDGKDLRAIQQKKKQIQDTYITSKLPIENEIANVQRLSSIQSANISNKYLGKQPGYSIPIGELTTLVDKKKPQIITVDNQYVDNIRNYYDIKGHTVKEYKNLNIYTYNYGKYYSYVEAMLVDIPDISKDILAGLMDIINSGIRIWNTMDPNIFAHYELLNKEVE